MIATHVDVGQITQEAFSNLLFWGTIIAAIFVIGLGYFFQKRKIIQDNWEKVLVNLIVFVGLPALIFKSFMIDLTLETFKNMAILFGLGIVFYLMISTGSRLFFLKQNKNLQDTLSMVAVFSSTVYFGLPIALALFSGDDPSAKAARVELNQAANIFNVGFWVFMCSYALYIIRRKNDSVGPDGKPMKTAADQKALKQLNRFTRKDFKNLVLSPIILTLIIGFVLWVMQLIPGIDLIEVLDDGWNTVPEGWYSITRLDALVPGVAQILNALAVLPTPLAWLAVGAVIAKSDLNAAFRNKMVWYCAFIKMLIIPLITLGLLSMFAAIGWAANDAFTISAPALIVIVLMSASPTATTVCGYTILYDKEPKIASQVCGLTTISAAVLMPLWTIVASIVAATDIFVQF